MSPTRPVLRYHGGKWRLAPWIIAHFPAHRVYVEPFGGGANVLLRKPRSTTEVYNDLDSSVVNLFKVIREQPADLARQLELTPFAREEYALLYERSEEPLEAARRFIARSFMGMNSKGAYQISGFDVRVNDDHFISRLRSLAKVPDQVAIVAGRLKHVVIENQDADVVIERFDRPEALIYCDPPYVHSTRSGKYYAHEYNDDQHRELASVLRAATGMVIVSGYPSPLYDELYGDWRCVSIKAHTDYAREATECLWLNPACVAALGHGPLFEAVA